jgi:hypothetical protein
MRSRITIKRISAAGQSLAILANRVMPSLPVFGTFLIAMSAVATGVTFLSLDHLISPDALSSLASAALIYSLAHLLRAGRLLLLAGSHTVSLRRLVEAHFLTAGVSMIVPLKLGEIYRAIELHAVTGSYSRAVLTIWIERSFDVAAICTLAAFAALTNPAGGADLKPLLMVSTVFVITTIFAFAILPKSLSSLSLFIIRRYNTKGAVDVLRIISSINSLVSHSAEMVNGKLIGLSTITAIIWYLEVTTLSFAAEMSPDWSTVTFELLSYLSAVSTGMTSLFTPPSDLIDSGFVSLSTGVSDLIKYEFSMRLPLMTLALLAGVSYAAWRIRSVRKTSKGSSMSHKMPGLGWRSGQ